MIKKCVEPKLLSKSTILKMRKFISMYKTIFPDSEINNKQLLDDTKDLNFVENLTVLYHTPEILLDSEDIFVIDKNNIYVHTLLVFVERPITIDHRRYSNLFTIDSEIEIPHIALSNRNKLPEHYWESQLNDRIFNNRPHISTKESMIFNIMYPLHNYNQFVVQLSLLRKEIEIVNHLGDVW